MAKQLLLILALLCISLSFTGCSTRPSSSQPHLATSFETTHFRFAGLDGWELSHSSNESDGFWTYLASYHKPDLSNAVHMYHSFSGSEALMDKLIDNISLSAGQSLTTASVTIGDYVFKKAAVNPVTVNPEKTQYSTYYYLCSSGRVYKFIGLSIGGHDPEGVEEMLNTFRIKSFTETGSIVSIGSNYTAYINPSNLTLSVQDTLLIQPIPDTNNYIDYIFKVKTTGASGVTLKGHGGEPISGTDAEISESIQKGNMTQVSLTPTSGPASFQVTLSMIDSGVTIASTNISVTVN